MRAVFNFSDLKLEVEWEKGDDKHAASFLRGVADLIDCDFGESQSRNSGQEIRWIPVMERLPDDHGCVLVCGPGRFSVPRLGIASSAYLTLGSFHDGQWSCYGEHKFDPTHWAEIPLPPTANNSATSGAVSDEKTALTNPTA